MTPQDALTELLARLGANNGAAVLVSEKELSGWPAAAIQAMKSQKLLVKAEPASSAVCPGCEQECVMPVRTLTHKTRGPALFIFCDKRDDINRVDVPINRLEQWQASGLAIADLLADLLGLRRPDAGDTSAGRWEIGMLKGKKGSSHLVLLADGRLSLTLAGHSIALADILALESMGFKLDKQTLVRLVDKPVAGAGDKESATQRRAMLKKRVQAEKNRGNKTFLKTVAGDEGISVSRLKQLLQEKPEPTKTRYSRSAY
jgi:hypothetical protein